MIQMLSRNEFRPFHHGPGIETSVINPRSDGTKRKKYCQPWLWNRW